MSAPPPSLFRVNHVKITFLVDNSIEWMSPLPPGFKSEMRRHMAEDPPIDDTITHTPILDLENYCCGAHGFSALIETEIAGQRYSTLFDTGPDSKSLVRNILSLKIDVLAISRVVLSHWHSDHSGGLLSFLRARSKTSKSPTNAQTHRQIVIDLHPDRPEARGIAPGPDYDKVLCRLPADPSFAEIEQAGGTVEKNDAGHSIAGGTIYISGEIPRVTPFEKGLPGGSRWKDGKWQSEWQIMDERYAVLDVVGKGLVIFSACSHAGIVNVARDAVAIFSRPVYMIIGGLHLGSSELHERIQPTVDFLSRDMRPAYILPMHCTGWTAKQTLANEFGDACVPAATGVTVEIDGETSFNEKTMAPVLNG